jgi:hypothetical protein
MLVWENISCVAVADRLLGIDPFQEPTEICRVGQIATRALATRARSPSPRVSPTASNGSAELLRWGELRIRRDRRTPSRIGPNGYLAVQAYVDCITQTTSTAKLPRPSRRRPVAQ